MRSHCTFGVVNVTYGGFTVNQGTCLAFRKDGSEDIYPMISIEGENLNEFLVEINGLKESRLTDIFMNYYDFQALIKSFTQRGHS